MSVKMMTGRIQRTTTFERFRVYASRLENVNLHVKIPMNNSSRKAAEERIEAVGDSAADVACRKGSS